MMRDSKSRDIRYFYEKGVRMFATDSKHSTFIIVLRRLTNTK